MAMESLQYKELLHQFGKDLKRTDEELYEATDGEVAPARREAAVAAGRRKLQEYAAMMARLDEGERAHADERFAERIADIRRSLEQLGEALP
jgi:hypothetical protein